MEKIIKVKNLQKTFKVEIKKKGFINRLKSLFKGEYKEIKAVSGISFEVKTGEKIAFIGPNGAGKSTTIKILSGILKETSGEVSVLGFYPSKYREKLVYKIGAVFGQTSRLWYHLTPKDSFELFAKLFDIKKKDFEKRLDFLTKEFGISSFLNTPVRKLSLGQRMRCEVVASLIHSPKIIFLDEPTIGLDIIAKQKLRDVINKINTEENTTIFLTSHDIGDIEGICERVIIINYGKILFDGDIKKLKKDYIKSKILSVKLSKNYKNLDFPDFVKIRKKLDDYIEIEIPNDKKSLEKTLDVLNKNYSFDDLSITEPSMEEVIKGFY